MNKTPKQALREKQTVEAVKNAAAAVFDVALEDINGSRRFPRMVFARHSAMYVIRKMSSLPYQEIAEAFGKTDHNSAFYACGEVDSRMNRDAGFAQKIAELMIRTDKLLANEESAG